MPDRTPLSNLLLTMLHRADVPVESIGDSTGECADVRPPILVCSSFA